MQKESMLAFKIQPSQKLDAVALDAFYDVIIETIIAIQFWIKEKKII